MTIALIASIWDITNNRSYFILIRTQSFRFNEDISIYNYISNDNTITYSKLLEMMYKYGYLHHLKGHFGTLI
ncbi:fatty acyl-CoA reductase wat-like isoform X2 [Vespula squamosa]|uniref:Fatty acyl-CoA reductase wat-like isoform X2 n=1 Tax=Vespula squamosa TaxID=30214 RepID=A0ABD2BTP6_VESSQ